MMTTKERINNDLKDAMRAKDKEKVNALRLITAAIKQVEVDERIEVDDARLLVILDKLAKQRQESITQFQRAQRDDLVRQEQFELDLIKQYLPAPLSDQEIESMITQVMTELSASKIADMGKVMALLKPQMQGRTDMARVSALVKARLE